MGKILKVEKGRSGDGSKKYVRIDSRDRMSIGVEPGDKVEIKKGNRKVTATVRKVGREYTGKGVIRLPEIYREKLGVNIGEHVVVNKLYQRETVVVQPPAYSQPRPLQRSGAITAASVLLGIIGGLALLEAMIVLYIGGAWVASGILEEIGEIIVLIGVIQLIVGVLYIVAANSLWNSKKSGGTLGIILCVIGIPVGILLAMTPLGLVGVGGLIVDVAIILLIAVGWDSLE